MVAEAGVVLERLQEAAAEAGMLFPLSLGAQGSCRIGGNISTNAGGTQVLAYGNTREPRARARGRAADRRNLERAARPAARTIPATT